MPIRTQRGRAAVWRRLWGWPLTSYRHLGITVVAAAAAGLLVSLALGGQHDPAAPDAHPRPVQAQHHPPPPAPLRPAPRPPVTPPSEVETPQPPPEEPEAPAVEPAPPEALQVADAFAGRFATPGLSTGQWVDQLRPYVTPETAGLLATVDPANVQLQLAGPPQPTKVTPAVLHVRIPLQHGALQLVLVHHDRWLVRSYDEVA